jgi:hypothetical protein
MADKRSIVYATGSDKNKMLQAIVFISFDLRIKLLSAKKSEGVYRKNSNCDSGSVV